MKNTKLQVLVLILTVKITFSQRSIEVANPALDLNLYQEVLDPDLCDRQLNYIQNNTNILAAFLDAGARTPKGILTGNLVDLGNYYQCLDINQDAEDMVLEGKYCVIDVPLEQEVQWPEFPEWPDFPEWPGWPEWLPEIPWPNITDVMSEETLNGVKDFNLRRSALLASLGEDTSRVSSDSSFAGQAMKLAVCVPKPCTPQQAIDRLVANLTRIGLKIEGNYCRLPNDKPWAPADYTLVAIFGAILILTILSTGYDIYYTVFLEKDPKTANVLYRSFSVYTNTRRLVTYTPFPGNLECVDGIRSFAMIWVILGHTFSTQLSWFIANPIKAMQWTVSYEALWTSAAPITVDTFFTLSGLLVVYTTAGKFTGWKLLQNLHLFYINRILRMFPILATGVLLQASLMNWAADGPYWLWVVNKVHKCRANWWATMLYVQTYVFPDGFCLTHTWYLAVDMHCYIICPIILFWVLNGKKTQAWIALAAGLLIALVASTVYNFLKNFKSGLLAPSSADNHDDYFAKYYTNTLTRASPFFVGMIWGYIMHLSRGKKLRIGLLRNLLIWTLAVVMGGLVIYSHYPVMQSDWDNQTVDNLLNSFIRPVWGLVIGWMIFACSTGYGGPINWILSLRMWKLPGRLSYAMYILHYPMLFVVNSTALSPTYFNIPLSMFTFIGHFFLAMFVAFLATILIDAPFTILIKLALGGGPKKNHPKKTDNDANMNNTLKSNLNISVMNQDIITSKTKL